MDHSRDQIEYWSSEEIGRFRQIECASQWSTAQSMLYELIDTTIDLHKRNIIARWAKEDLADRLSRLGSINQPRFRVAYDNLFDIMNGCIADNENLLRQQRALKEHGDGDSVSVLTARIIVTSRFTDVVRIFEAMKAVGIISDQTPDQQIVDYCFVEGSTAQNLRANLASTRKDIREGSKARGKELLNFMKELGKQLSPRDKDKLIASL